MWAGLKAGLAFDVVGYLSEEFTSWAGMHSFELA